ncbi:GNAT family N-acetyltransferase [Microbacterium caowuchunii]|uniref:GNAT family N-acetyltransferase n=1 Tax=Microbacterium caowuchunii TaxID=2614638 RepID=UPI0012477495|nr:GNAT family N-acetyltransferase [Microbacterium caowuchunii]QEW01076.1 GNAT family N-acetyltransferase [Microbacterium caowuchunii]
MTEIRPLETPAQVAEANAVLRAVWQGDHDAVPSNTLIALAYAGNYAVGLYEDGRMVGASVGFFGPPADLVLHSHVTGILSSHRGRGLGKVMKRHQRDWARERGIERITWTFDPLVGRNARFNLGVLGARATAYLVDHYGSMDDGVNRGDQTDRIFVEWSIGDPAPGLDGPGAVVVPPQDIAAAVAVPEDIERMRAEAPIAAATWRRIVRDEIRGHLAEGLRIVTFDERGYLFSR